MPDSIRCLIFFFTQLAVQWRDKQSKCAEERIGACGKLHIVVEVRSHAILGPGLPHTPLDKGLLSSGKMLWIVDTVEPTYILARVLCKACLE